MKLTLRTLATLSVITTSINGCSSPHQENFKCPAGPGYSCKSLSYVHEQIQNGSLKGTSEEQGVNIYLPPQPEDN